MKDLGVENLFEELEQKACLYKPQLKITLNAGAQ
jgi:hypothetical protein